MGKTREANRESWRPFIELLEEPGLDYSLNSYAFRCLDFCAQCLYSGKSAPKGMIIDEINQKIVIYTTNLITGDEDRMMFWNDGWGVMA